MLIEFCLPIHNEEAILEDNAKALLFYLNNSNLLFPWKIILLINGSSDNSNKIAQNLKTNNPEEIEIINYPEPGRGRALKKYFISSSADILVYMDTDLSVSLKNIKDLVDPLISDNYDLAIGSRLLPESKIKRSFIRELSSQTYNFLARLVLKHHFSDMQCGFKAIKKDAFLKIAPNITDPNWFFDTELIILSDRLGYRVKEVPVDWEENRYETRKSKVKLIRDSLKFIKNLIKFRGRLSKIKI